MWIGYRGKKKKIFWKLSCQGDINLLSGHVCQGELLVDVHITTNIRPIEERKQCKYLPLLDM